MASTVFLPDIDYDWHPVSYSDFDHPLRAILNGIPTQERRRLVRAWLELHPGTEIPIELLSNRATATDRRLADEVHPNWLGGQFLPPTGDRTVEIARVAMASTTGDVFSLRATWSGGRWRYAMTDEYPDIDFDWVLPRKTSRRPLPLRTVVELIDRTWMGSEGDPNATLVWGWLEHEGGQGGYHEGLRRFHTVESDIYPDLERHYRANIDAWCDRHATAQLLREV